MQTYYEQLGVPQNASPEVIKKAYRKLAKQHHPDVNGGSAASEKKFREIKEAFQVLGDEASRKAYDEKLKQGFTSKTSQERQASQTTSSPGQAFHMGNMSQQFEQFFGFNPRTGKKTEQQKEQHDAASAASTRAIFESYFGVRKK